MRVARLSPRMSRLTLGGSSLSEFVSLAPDDHVKLLVPPEGVGEPHLPSIEAERLSWSARGPRPIARDYTPVRFDPVKGELDLDIVLHEGGLIASWLQQATPGTIAGVAGPRGSHLVTPAPQQLLLVGDETALPAIWRWLRELPAGARALVLVEVQSEEDCLELASAAELEVQWLVRGKAKPGTTNLLLDALKGCELSASLEHFWLAGEAGMVRKMREHLVSERGVDPELLAARGYWKLGVNDHQEPHED